METVCKFYIIYILIISSALQVVARKDEENQNGDIDLDNLERSQRSDVYFDDLYTPIDKFYGEIVKIEIPSDDFQFQMNFKPLFASRREFSAVDIDNPDTLTIRKRRIIHHTHLPKPRLRERQRKYIFHKNYQKYINKNDHVHQISSEKLQIPNQEAGRKRMIYHNLDQLQHRCKRQFSPICRYLYPIGPCFGSNCQPNSGGGDIISNNGFNFDNFGSRNCLPGMPNCVLTPLYPGGTDLKKATGILFLPKSCGTDNTGCIPDNSVPEQGGTVSSPLPPVTAAPPPAAPPPVVVAPSSGVDAHTVALPPATVELRIEPSQEAVAPEICVGSTGSDSLSDKCVTYHGKKYRLVPWESTMCSGPGCSDFSNQGSYNSYSTPVPEDCVTTLKDMDLSLDSIRKPMQCQKATLRVVINLGRTVSQLERALNQIYNVGSCSLRPADTKLIARVAHQLLLNGCCSPTGGRIMRVGGGCRK